MRKSVVFLWLLLVVIVGVSGCAGDEGMSSPTPTQTPAPTETPVSLFLEIAEPEEESVVSASSITVSGSTAPGAVVSVLVGDTIDMVDVGEAGNFTVTVGLEEGPNVIEIIASDWKGNEVSKILDVISTL